MPDSTIVPVRRVSAYRTTDAGLHETRRAAERHQARLDLADLLKTESCLDEQDSAALAERLMQRGEEITKMLRNGNKEDV